MAVKFNVQKNNKGMAILEMIPIIVIVMLLLNFSIGFFGAIHTGILQSISARNYAFETFRHQPNLYYLRQPSTDPAALLEEFSAGNKGVAFESSLGNRVHGTTGKFSTSADPERIASARNISFFKDLSLINITMNPEAASGENSTTVHNENGNKNILSTNNNYGNQNESVQSITSIWVRPQYGICFDSRCGD